MKILFLGDFFYDYDHIRDDIYELGEHFGQYDAVVLNLEAPLKSAKPYKKWINLHQNERMLPEVLKILNVKVVSLANNHIFDWSEEGYYKIASLLNEMGIVHFGVQNAEDTWKPLSIDIGGVPFDFYGCGWEEEQAISLNKKKLFIKNSNLNNLPYPVINSERFSVIIPHWGYEYELLPLPVFVEYGRKLIDVGIDLVIGSHPHVIQPFEEYMGKKIFYSLGNFYFGSKRETFALGLCDLSYGVEIEMAKIHSNLNINIIGFEYNRKNKSTQVMPQLEKWTSSILYYEINKDLNDYNNVYRKTRYGTKPSLLYGQKNKNNIKLLVYDLKRTVNRFVLALLCFASKLKTFIKNNKAVR